MTPPAIYASTLSRTLCRTHRPTHFAPLSALPPKADTCESKSDKMPTKTPSHLPYVKEHLERRQLRKGDDTKGVKRAKEIGKDAKKKYEALRLPQDRAKEGKYRAELIEQGVSVDALETLMKAYVKKNNNLRSANALRVEDGIYMKALPLQLDNIYYRKLQRRENARRDRAEAAAIRRDVAKQVKRRKRRRARRAACAAKAQAEARVKHEKDTAPKVEPTVAVPTVAVAEVTADVDLTTSLPSRPLANSQEEQAELDSYYRVIKRPRV